LSVWKIESGIWKRKQNRNRNRNPNPNWTRNKTNKNWRCFEGVTDNYCSSRTFHLHMLYLLIVAFCSSDESIEIWGPCENLSLLYLEFKLDLLPRFFSWANIVLHWICISRRNVFWIYLTGNIKYKNGKRKTKTTTFHRGKELTFVYLVHTWVLLYQTSLYIMLLHFFTSKKQNIQLLYTWLYKKA